MATNWEDIRAALAVARSGTVSGAAEALQVHHATIIRRVASLEAQLGAKLFQRHPRGYALTEAGRTLLRAATEADERFAQMAAQIASAGDRVEGELVVTSLPELSDRVLPPLIGLMARHEGLRLRYITDARLFRLDVGEAHLAIRAGARPTQPDYVVQPLGQVRIEILAAPEYLARCGPVDDPATHRFCVPGPEARNAPMMRWLVDHVPEAQIVMISSDADAREAMIRAGQAIGPLPGARAAGLIRVAGLPEWDAPLWLVTHVDLHRTPKVQAALRALRDKDDRRGFPFDKG